MFNKLSKKMSKFGGNIDVEKRDIFFTGKIKSVTGKSE